MSKYGSSNFMKPIRFAGSGILGSEQLQNPDFYNWNKVYVRYCDGASFSGDAEGEDKDGTKLFFRGLRIWEAVIDELMEKGLANATQALLTGCSAGGLSTLLHCDDFSARFPQDVSVKCFADAGFFLDIFKMFLYRGSSSPDKSWVSCKNNIQNCNSTEIKVLHGFRKTLLDHLKVVEDKDWGLFIDSCFTHCQTVYNISWNSPISPRVGSKTIAEAVGDWQFGSSGVKEIDCEYPCNPTCSTLLPQ